MKRNRWLFSLIAMLTPLAASALIAGESGNRPISDPGWPDGALALANLQSRTGWWEGPPFGGGEWQFFYRGDAQTFSNALTRFAAIRAPSLELVLHDEPETNSFVEGDGRVDWTFTVWQPDSWNHLYNNPKSDWNATDPNFHKPVAPPRLDVYIGGGQMDWSKVKVPAGIQVEDERSSTVNSSGLSLTIRCTDTVFKAGDEIPIEFIITNQGTNDYKYSDRTYDRSGRMDEYKLEAKTESGGTVPDPRASNRGMWIVGGLFNFVILHPGQSFTKTIPLNRWALVKDAGRYNIVGIYLADQYSTNSETIQSEPITINVSPRTESEINAYIGDLTNQIFGIPPVRLVASTQMPEHVRVTNSMANPDIGNLVMKLMYTCSPKIVPTLLQTMYEPASSGFWEAEALQFYVPHSEAVKKAILKTAIDRGLDSHWAMNSVLRSYDLTADEIKPVIERSLAADNQAAWAAGISLAQQYWEDDFAPRVIAILNTPGNGAHVPAVTALAYNRTDEGVKALKAILKTPEPGDCLTLGQTLENAYDPWRKSPGKRLKRDDLTVEDVKPLVSQLLASKDMPSIVTGVHLEEQFGSDDFTAQLIAIATTPGHSGNIMATYALALNRTEDGLETLKKLLHGPDGTLRTTAAEAIRYAYTSRGTALGRPLKPDDFDKTYQQPANP